MIFVMLISFASQKLKWQLSDYLCSVPVLCLLDSIKFLVSEKKIPHIFMLCLAMVAILNFFDKNMTFKEGHIMIIPTKEQFHQTWGFLKLSHSENIIDPSSHVEFSKSKILYYVEDYKSSIYIHVYQVWFKLCQCFVRK